MLVVRLIWVGAVLLVIAVGILYVSDPSTMNWYLYLLAALPLVILMLLRALAIQKGRDEPAVDNRGWGIDGGGPFGPP
jgi:Na+/proline symporter